MLTSLHITFDDINFVTMSKCIYVEPQPEERSTMRALSGPHCTGVRLYTLWIKTGSDLFLGNTCFNKRDSHLITYRSGNTATQIDFMLFRKSLRKLVMDVKVIPGKEVALQHQLLVCDMMIDMPPQIKRKFTPRPKVWKLRDPQTCSRFQEVFKAHVPAVETEAATTTEEIWAKLKTGLLKTTEEVCGTTKPHRWRRETWW